MVSSFERKQGFIIALERQREWLRIITDYKRIVGMDDRSPNIHNLIGDIYMKIGNTSKAMKEYAEIIERYAEGGSFDNCIAACKKIIGILQYLT